MTTADSGHSHDLVALAVVGLVQAKHKAWGGLITPHFLVSECELGGWKGGVPILGPKYLPSLVNNHEKNKKCWMTMEASDLSYKTYI